MQSPASSAAAYTKDALPGDEAGGFRRWRRPRRAPAATYTRRSIWQRVAGSSLALSTDKMHRPGDVVVAVDQDDALAAVDAGG